MINWSKRLVPAIATTSLLLGSGAVAAGVSHAEKAILIPGAMPFKQINPVYPSVALTYPDIGMHFHSDQDPQLVVYTQDPLDSTRALADGVKQTTSLVHDGEKVVIIGESMGAMVAWRAAVALADSSDPPNPNDVRVVLIAPPDVGVAEYFKEGTYIPILNYRISRIAESPYPTTIIVGEYDGWSDPPDRPWNVISSANALAGIAYVHGPPSFTVDPNDLPAVEPVGKVTTHLVPTKNLPLTQVFRDVGVPDELVDKADQVLRPLVDAGYVRHDQPGDNRPYLYDGEIHRNVQSQQQARPPVSALTGSGTDVGQQRREHRSELRQAVRAVGENLRERVEAGFTRRKQRIAERRAYTEAVTPEPAPGT